MLPVVAVACLQQQKLVLEIFLIFLTSRQEAAVVFLKQKLAFCRLTALKWPAMCKSLEEQRVYETKPWGLLAAPEHSLCSFLSPGCYSQLCLLDTGAAVAPSCRSASGYTVCPQVLPTEACIDKLTLDMGCLLSFVYCFISPHILIS